MYTSHAYYVIVDDDSINNFITKRVITEINPHAQVKTFTNPEKGLDYVISTFAKPSDGKIIILLDINMPAMTGWQFMERLEQEGSIVNERLLIYILSSSIDPRDKERAKMNPNISDYIMKPLKAVEAHSFA